MKSRLIFLTATLLMAAGCKHHSPTGPDSPSGLTETLVGKLFWHDQVNGKYTIFMANLYMIPKMTAVSGGMIAFRFPNINQNRLSFKERISTLENAEIDGNLKERLVLNAVYPLDQINTLQNDLVLKNIENLGEPAPVDQFAVALNSRNWIAYVRDVDGFNKGTADSEIVYMNLADRVRHQLTPLNGRYGGNNVDPEWKDDNTIVWDHLGRIVEVNLNNLDNVTEVVPEMTGWEFDPVYSPDLSMILFNYWHDNKKNSYIKYIQTGVFETVLPQDYFARYMDDNPTWIFSSTRISGHLFMQGKGRIYTRNIRNGKFSIITDDQHDFRYVTPVKFQRSIYLVFSDWTDPNRPKLWISDETGTYLRELNQTGDESVFQILGLPIPHSQEDMERIASDYSLKFNHN